MSGTPFTPYQRRLFLFLSVATFFEGYDFMVLTRALPTIREFWDLDRGDAGLMFTIINVGTVLAYLLIRLADRIGRRRTLTITIFGYTLFTFLTGLAPDPISFTVAQFIARIFLIAEWATSTLYAAEEFPADRRGTVIGVITGFSTLGAVLCAGVMPFLLQTEWGWRTAYFVAILPLGLLAYARRNLKETRRFAEQVGKQTSKGLLHIWRTPYRNRVVHLALIWSCMYLCTNIAVMFWTDFAKLERGFTEKQVSAALTIASVVAVPMVFYSGKLLDVLGRRPGASVIIVLGTAGAFLSYTFHDRWPLTIALIFGVFGVSAFLPALNAFTTELFPTELRADAFAWCNNLLGRVGYVVSPIIVGQFGERYGTWSTPVQATCLFPVIALVLIWWLLPETGNQELEQSSALASE